MPLDPSNFLAPSVIARQIGGRAADTESAVWKVLFPNTETRIDGRVPVDRSSQYLLNNCMNVTKELIAVYFSPSTEADTAKLEELRRFLIGKK